ncbi:hypothetical protein [Glutamicibacter sp. NPDC087344]|uniref:hypothetical protein n=1 Tax=Glutamicibacter sp. NPDC087344 TaxID=3363994 RepID=UPI0038103784
MNGSWLRLCGAMILLPTLVLLLSGWSVLFTAEGAVVTIVQFALLLTGLVMVYRGENPRRRASG